MNRQECPKRLATARSDERWLTMRGAEERGNAESWTRRGKLGAGSSARLP